MRIDEIASSPDVTKCRKVANLVRSVFGLKRKDAGFGMCAVVTVGMWDQLGQPRNLVPYSCMVGEEEHVVLRASDRTIIDPTCDQFDYPFYSSSGAGLYKSFYKLKPEEIGWIREEGLTT